MPITCDLIDVFGDGPLSGNPLAVVHGAGDLSADQMLALTQWLGFSETTFLLPPTETGADYKVRIFYPGGELPFAGHPTLGSCFSWLHSGGKPSQAAAIVQECGVGLIEIRQSGEQLSFKAPELLHHAPLSDAEKADAIRLTGVDEAAVIEAVHVSNGPNWQLLRLRNAADVLAAEPASKAALGTDIGLAGPHADSARRDWELRAFFADAAGRFVEDRVTGSFNAGVAMHLFGNGLASGIYRAGQGQRIGADGLVECRQDGKAGAWIGGACRMIALSGTITAFD